MREKNAVFTQEPDFRVHYDCGIWPNLTNRDGARTSASYAARREIVERIGEWAQDAFYVLMRDRVWRIKNRVYEQRLRFGD